MSVPERILLIRPSALGDVCRSVPVLASLRRAWPQARIDWLIQDSFVDAVRAHPGLSGVLEFPRQALGRALSRGRLGELHRWVRDLRAPGYDLAIDAQGLFRSALFARLTGAGDRVGHRAARELGWVLYNRRERGSEGMHTVERMLGLVRVLGIEPVRDMRLYPPEEDVAAVAGDASLGGRIAVIAPTSRWAGKQWPAERFDALVGRLLDEKLIDRAVVVGGAGERAQCGALLERAEVDWRVVDLVGRTSIGRLLAVIRRCDLVVANDSAALHMAAGLERPMVALYGPTRVERVGPYGREADVIQHLRSGDRLDHKHNHAGRLLMERIGVEEVFAACAERLSRGAARTPA